MSFRLVGIREAGDAQKERVVIRAISGADIGKYMLAVTRLKDGVALSGRSVASFWFPDKLLSEGDLVVVYSKIGKASEKVNLDGKKTYFFYMGSDIPFFKDPLRSVVLMKIEGWNMSVPDLSDAE
jgi:hypothetical protein